MTYDGTDFISQWRNSVTIYSVSRAAMARGAKNTLGSVDGNPMQIKLWKTSRCWWFSVSVELAIRISSLGASKIQSPENLTNGEWEDLGGTSQPERNAENLQNIKTLSNGGFRDIFLCDRNLTVSFEQVNSGKQEPIGQTKKKIMYMRDYEPSGNCGMVQGSVIAKRLGVSGNLFANHVNCWSPRTTWRMHGPQSCHMVKFGLGYP